MVTFYHFPLQALKSEETIFGLPEIWGLSVQVCLDNFIESKLYSKTLLLRNI